MLRAIHCFLNFENMAVIEELRKAYDPLFGLIPPHVTLVFPFESDILADELRNHIQKSILGHRPFQLMLQGITGADGEYLFLNVKVGNDSLIALHDALYTGRLEQFLNRRLTYVPHLTLGRFPDSSAFQIAIEQTRGSMEKFECTVWEVVVETIDMDGISEVESTIPFSSLE